ncbi:MAG TPA: ubiquinol-cytochrome C chaperone family protein [Caulobacteraceae bacterium]|nr:ubiquinol-cytochrome C chaperone family protein [Caulobacteraceae bacterium]
MSLGRLFAPRLFAPRPAAAAGRRLYAAAVAQARQPALYEGLGAPDTPEGRFELYTLHVVLLLHRLKGQGPRAAETGQALFDAYVRALDDGLRELGVGDLSVGKKMRKLGEAFYGRAKAYDQALEDGPGLEALEALIGRTLEGADSAGVARYAADTGGALARQPLEHLLEGEVEWPKIAV